MAPKKTEDAPVHEGEVIAGKYVVERILGAGGMGVVVAAHHLHLEERVAIKFLRPSVADQDPAFEARFAREGRAAARIKSEHVARVKDFGALETGASFLVMEYLDGQDLAKVLTERRRIPVEDAIDYVLQACEALAEAHALGIVHRDLKPANFFLTRRADRSACVKLLDFGISKILDEVDRMTSTRDVMGSPLYMSPEQMLSPREVDPRADIWSLGVILFELVSGTTPFEGESMLQLAAHVLEMRPKRLREVLPSAPPELEEIIARCLQKDPKKRFASVGQLVLALSRVAPAQAQLSVERVARIGIESDTTIDESAMTVDEHVLGSAQRNVTLTAERPIPVPHTTAPISSSQHPTPQLIPPLPPRHHLQPTTGAPSATLTQPEPLRVLPPSTPNADTGPRSEGRTSPITDRPLTITGVDPRSSLAAGLSRSSAGKTARGEPIRPAVAALLLGSLFLVGVVSTVLVEQATRVQAAVSAPPPLLVVTAMPTEPSSSPEPDPPAPSDARDTANAAATTASPSVVRGPSRASIGPSPAPRASASAKPASSGPAVIPDDRL